MSTLSNLISDPIASALGWTLIHSIWQAALTALALALVTPLLKNHSSQTRYLISISSLGFLLVLSLITFCKYYSSPVELAQVYPEATGSAFTFTSVGGQGSSGFSLSGFINSNAFLIVNIWITGVLLFTIRMLGGWLYLQRVLKIQITAIAPEWQDKVKEIQQKINLKKYISIAESGHIKPLILLPVGAVSGLSPRQIEAVIAHEIAHISRNDFLVNIVQSLAEILFFFNPAFWWISKVVRRERENCCDDLAIEICNDSLVLAQALTALEEIRIKNPGLALAFTGNDGLLNRILRLVNPSRLKPSFYENITATGILTASILCILICLGANGNALSQNLPESRIKDTPAPRASRQKAASPEPLRNTVRDTLKQNEAPAPVKEEDQQNLSSGEAASVAPSAPVPPTPPAPGNAAQSKEYQEAMERFKAKMKEFEERTQKTGKADMELFDKAMEEFDKGMKEFDKGMEAFDREMEKFDRGMEEFDKGMREFDKGMEKFSREFTHKMPPMPSIPPMPAMPPMPKVHRIDPDKLSADVYRETVRRHKEAIKQIEKGVKRYEKGWKEKEAGLRSREKKSRESNERERDRSRDFERVLERELKRDGLITDNADYRFKLDESGLIVNGKKQPKELHGKYVKIAREMIGSEVKKIKKTKEVSGNSTNSSFSVTK
jgi:bla regulator protein blaR1